jgi:PucR family transcriptional regulator, purine catabolism regulatory protein
MNMAESVAQVSLGDLARLAFPLGTQLPPAPCRDRAVKWIVIAGAGVVPQAGDVVLCGTSPAPAELAAWAERGVAGIVLPSGFPILSDAGLPVILLPAGASLRDVQQSALQLIINRQSYLIERGTLIYQNLTRYAVEGGGLDAMARAMFELTGKTIVLQDKRLKPLALMIAPGLDQAWPETLAALGRLPEDLRDRRQAALGGWRVQALPGGLVRLVCPIVAKGLARGYLSIVGRAGELDTLDQLVVEHGAAACALEMAKAKAVSEAEKRAHGDFVDAVLAGTLPPEELAGWAQRIGYDMEPPHAASVWRWAHAETDKDAPSLRRLETIVHQSVAAQGVNALVRSHGQVLVFCAVSGAARPEAALALADAILAAAAAEYPQHGLYGGIGGPVADLTGWKDSYRQATQALSMAVRLDERAPLYFGDLSVYRLLLQLEGNPELETFCQEMLGPLLSYEGGGDLVETLEAFFDRLGNLSQTAEKLFIHRNSLLYRMERIAQLTGLDLDNPDTRLTVHLALKARKMLRPAKL